MSTAGPSFRRRTSRLRVPGTSPTCSTRSQYRGNLLRDPPCVASAQEPDRLVVPRRRTHARHLRLRNRLWLARVARGAGVVARGPGHCLDRQLTGLIPLGILCFLFLLFPTGPIDRFGGAWPGGSWQGCSRSSLAFFMVFATMNWDDPYAPPPPGGSPLWALLPVSLLADLVLCVAAVIVRFRGSVGEERLQLKWFATGASVFIVLFIPTFASTAPVWLVVQSLAFVFLFTTIAVAVLKYRLYDIDVVISKTVVYACSPPSSPPSTSRSWSASAPSVGRRGNPFLTVAAAVVIAIAFNPVRERAKTPREPASSTASGPRPTRCCPSSPNGWPARYDSIEDVLPRMARPRRGDRRGAAARVAAGRPRAASGGVVADGRRAVADPSPVDGDDLPGISGGVERVVAVRHQGELLGALTVTKPPNDPLNPPKEQACRRPRGAGRAGAPQRPADRGAARLAAAARHRAGRGAPSSSSATSTTARSSSSSRWPSSSSLAQPSPTRDPARRPRLLDQLKAEATDALEDLRDLARGIYPPLLADKGLADRARGAGPQGRRSRSTSRPTASGATRRRWRPPSTSAASRPCRTSRSTRARAKRDPTPDAHGHARVRGQRRRRRVRSGVDRLRHRAAGHGRPPGRTGRTPRGRSAPGRGTTVAGRLPNAQS